MRFGARDFDARVGRWTSRDPSLLSGADANLYRYSANDPINLIDSKGRYFETPGGGYGGKSCLAAKECRDIINTAIDETCGGDDWSFLLSWWLEDIQIRGMPDPAECLGGGMFQARHEDACRALEQQCAAEMKPEEPKACDPNFQSCPPPEEVGGQCPAPTAPPAPAAMSMH